LGREESTHYPDGIMNDNMTQKILEDLNSMFSQEWLQKIADETGLIKRSG
jgi:hypothetical protein